MTAEREGGMDKVRGDDGNNPHVYSAMADALAEVSERVTENYQIPPDTLIRVRAALKMARA